jgi:hypothetical protein
MRSGGGEQVESGSLQIKPKLFRWCKFQANNSLKIDAVASEPLGVAKRYLLAIKMPIQNRREIACLTLICVVAVAALTALHVHDMHYPACAGCDSERYGQSAAAIKETGLFGPWVGSRLRTYGYPLFVSLVPSGQDLALPMGGYFTSNVAIVQSLLYIAACLTLFSVLYPTSRAAAWCCAVGLL